MEDGSVEVPVEQTEQEQVNPHLAFDGVDLTEDKITEKLSSFNSRWDTFSGPLFEKLKSYYRAYREMQYTVEKVSVKIPEIFTIIQTEVPFLLNGIFGQSQVLDATAKYNDPDGAKTYKIKSYINKLIKDICKGKAKTELIITNLLIYGYSPIKMYWNTDPQVDIDPATKAPVQINSAHPDFYLVDNFSFAWDPDYTEQNMEKIDWVRERIFLSKDKMKSMRDAGLCADFADEDMTSKDDEGKKLRNPDNSDTKKNGTYYDEFYVTIYHKVTDETGEEKTIGEEFRAWFLANKKLIKFEKNAYGYKPFTIVRGYSNPGEILGMGECEVVGPIASQLSYTHNQSGKMIKKLGQNLTFIDPSAGISPQNLNRIEQGVLFVKNIEGIKSEKTADPQNVSVLINYKEYLDSQIERVTGVGKSLQGQYTGDISATQASIVSQNSSNRLASKLSHLQEELIVPLAEIFFLMNKQLLELPVEFFDTNNNLISLQPEDFIGNYEWISLGSISQSNKALQLSQNAQLLQNLIQLSQASIQTGNPFTVNIPEFIKQHLAPYANIADIGNIVVESNQNGQGNPSLPPQGPVSNTPQNASPIQNAPQIPVKDNLVEKLQSIEQPNLNAPRVFTRG